MSRSRRGVTLVEVVASTLLVGVVLVGALETLGMAARQARAAADRADAHTLAEDLLAEALSQPYDDPDETTSSLGLDTGETGGDRTTYDDVDDYNNLSNTTPRLRDGTVLSRYTGWTRQVQVQYVKADAKSDGTVTNYGSDQGVKRVTVTVTGPGGDTATAHALCTRYGPTERPAPLDGTWVTRLRASVTLSSGGVASVSAALANEPEAPR